MKFCTKCGAQLFDDAMAAYVEICLNLIYGATGLQEFSARRKELIRELRKEVRTETFARLKKKVKINRLLVMLLNVWVKT